MLIDRGIVNLRVPDYPVQRPAKRAHFKKKPAAAGSFHSDMAQLRQRLKPSALTLT
jgi:hypothetical protein